MNLLQFISWLKALGPKLPAILAAIQSIYDAFASTADEATPRAALSAEEEAAVADLLDSLPSYERSAERALDGHRIANLFKFLNDSGLLSLLMGLAVGK